MAKQNNPTRHQQVGPQPGQIIHQQTQITRHGPLPDPLTLKQYDEVMPGFANRVITLAEGESKHRREMDKNVIWMNFILNILGNLSGLAAISGVVWLCWYSISLGFANQAATIAVGVLASIAGVFVYRKHAEKKV